MLLSDYGRSAEKAGHSDPCARNWNTCKTTTDADVIGKKAEKEAIDNAKKKR